MSSPKLRWVIVLSLTVLVVGNMVLYLQYRRDLPDPTLSVGHPIDIADVVIAVDYNATTNIISIIVKIGWNFTGSADLLNRIPSVNEFIRIRGIYQSEGYILIQEGYVMSSMNSWIIRFASVGGYILVLTMWVLYGISMVKKSKKDRTVTQEMQKEI
jgi:hypothetical protein